LKLYSKKKYKYEEFTKESIEEFLKLGEELKIKMEHAIDEKRNLDFKKIIQSEIKDTESKIVIYIDKEYNLTEIIKALLYE